MVCLPGGSAKGDSGADDGGSAGWSAHSLIHGACRQLVGGRAAAPGGSRCVQAGPLADRLRDLQAAGVVRAERARLDPYELPDRGQALRPVVRELIRWGAPLMVTGPGEDVVQDHWATLALEAVLDSDRVTGAATRVRMTAGETAVDVVLSRRGRSVEPVAPEVRPDAELVGALPQLLASAYVGGVDPGLTVRGDRAAVERALQRG
jgi:DNA-binding Lrp family transcriptional regulator